MAETSSLYAPSWIDRLTAWVRRLPLPAWMVYPALGLSLTLLMMSIAWAGGGLAMNASLLNYFRSGISYAYFLALIHYLDNAAAAALARFRPVLTVDEGGYTKLRYQLTTLPARPTLIAAGIGVVYALATLLVNVLNAANHGREVPPPVVIVLDVSFSLWIHVLLGGLAYHTLHQLRMVNTIYTHYTRINLFQLGPLYALSGLAARTAIGLGLATYVWFQVTSLSAPGASASDIFQLVVWASIIAVTFVWPLFGAHNLLEREKQRLQDNVARRIEATLAELHQRIDSDDMTERGALKETLDILITEQGVIDKLRTWPWRTGTVSSVGLAFLLPIFIWIVQRVLERLGI